jgi:hypothetical protein
LSAAKVIRIAFAWGTGQPYANRGGYGRVIFPGARRAVQWSLATAMDFLQPFHYA